MIDLRINEEVLKRSIEHVRKCGIIIPTFKQMRDPSLVPKEIFVKLKDIGLWDVNPLNLFRVNWHNEPKERGGLFGGVNYIELPRELTGVNARIVVMIGKWFPTGCHKVGSAFGCLVPRLITGQFDPTFHKSIWPSSGNYCRGGAYNSALLGCESISIMPQGMSRERFEWLEAIGGEIITTPGCESNMKEIFDKSQELRKFPENMIFNQFEEQGNALWHYHVTGPAMVEVFESIANKGDNFAGVCLGSGSGGTLSSSDYVKDHFPKVKIAVAEALQCPTLLENGFGDHRIEGIGNKHVPWIHNVKNSDVVMGIDDEASCSLLRLFNEPEGKEYLKKELKLVPEFVEKLSWLGISGISNAVSAIKFSKYYELTEKDIVVTVATDSVMMYGSRLEQYTKEKGSYSIARAFVDHERFMLGITTDHLQELTYLEKKRMHNLKYFTWVEQQDRTEKELNDQWYDYDNYWKEMYEQVEEIDNLIKSFNQEVGLLG